MKTVTKDFIEYEVGDSAYFYLFSGYGPHLIAKCTVEEVVRIKYYQGNYHEPRYKVRITENYLDKGEILYNRYREGNIEDAGVRCLMLVWEG
jgi:hypothetical protein